MIKGVFEIFQYDFFQHALLASVLASITCGIIGTYIVSRRIVFISGGITHSSFGGIGIAYFLGYNPIFGAIIFAVLSAIGVEIIAKKTDIREDSAIGILWSLGMAIGIIFLYMTPGYVPNLMSYLFGSILTVSGTDLLLMVSVAVLLGIFMLLFLRPVIYTAFDPEYAKTHRAPVALLNYLMMSMVALAVVVNIKVVGIILVISLLTLPQTIANLFTKQFTGIIYLSVIVSFIGIIAGLIVSYTFNIPSGASIIFALIILFALSKLYKYFQKLILTKANT